MIDPHVLHGGASSWFLIAAWLNSLAFLPTSDACDAIGAAAGAAVPPVCAKTDDVQSRAIAMAITCLETVLPDACEW